MVDDQGGVESGDNESQAAGDQPTKQTVQPSDDTVIEEGGLDHPEDTDGSAVIDDEPELDADEDEDEDEDEEMFTMEVPEDFSVDKDLDEFD